MESIWRRNVHQNSIYNSPSNILRIYASFQSYFQKYDKSRRHMSSISAGMNGLTLACWEFALITVVWMHYNFDNSSYRNGAWICKTLKLFRSKKNEHELWNHLQIHTLVRLQNVTVTQFGKWSESGIQKCLSKTAIPKYLSIQIMLLIYVKYNN